MSGYIPLAMRLTDVFGEMSRLRNWSCRSTPEGPASAGVPYCQDKCGAEYLLSGGDILRAIKAGENSSGCGHRYALAPIMQNFHSALSESLPDHFFGPL